MIRDEILREYLSRPAVALYGDLIRGLLWAAAAVSWLLFTPFFLWRLAGTGSERSDFPIFYYTARLVADGEPMYGSSPARFGLDWAGAHLGNLNPPHFQMLLQPLVWLSYEHAFVVWSFVNAGALVAALVLVVRGLRIRVTFSRAFGVGALLVASAPFTSVAITAEWSFLLMLPFTAAWIDARRARWGRAGAWLGVCISLKLFFLLFVPWLALRGQWKALAWGGCVVALSVAAGVIVHGWPTYALWLQSLQAADWWWLPMNASWQGLVWRLADGGGAFRPLVDAPSFVHPVALAGFLVCAAISVWAAARVHRLRGGVDEAFLILLLGALLASPLGWVYYFPLALGPLAAVIAHGSWRAIPTGARVAALGAAAGLYVPVEYSAAGQPSVAATLTLASSYSWPLIAGWLALVLMARPVESGSVPRPVPT